MKRHNTGMRTLMVIIVLTLLISAGFKVYEMIELYNYFH